jgi:hypothetical protein
MCNMNFHILNLVSKIVTCQKGTPGFDPVPYKILNHLGFIRTAYSILCCPHKRELDGQDQY